MSGLTIMKIFRGPSEKSFSDDTHQLVAEPDLDVVKKWPRRRACVRANASKEPHERQAVVHLLFEPSDVLKLQASLVQSLIDDSKRCDEMEDKVHKLRAVLAEIAWKATYPPSDALAEIRALAEKGLGSPAP